MALFSFILYRKSKWVVQVTKLLLSIESALIHLYLKFWCHGLSLKMSYEHCLLLICLLSTLLAFSFSSWMMHSSLQNLLFIFSCACFKAEFIISCATWHIRERAFLVMKTVTIIKWRLMERLFLWISSVPVMQYFPFRNWVAILPLQLWYFLPLFYPHEQIMNWAVISPQTVACSSSILNFRTCTWCIPLNQPFMNHLSFKAYVLF